VGEDNGFMTIRHSLVPTVLGDLTVVANDESISGLYFPGHWYLPPASSIGDRVGADPVIDEAAGQLRDYLAGTRRSFDLEVTTNGDALQESVWAMLREIPFGETTTYGSLAERLGNRSLAQAVGQAVGHNPVSIIIPCHRVVGASGKLTGFAGGLERKLFLLELEEPELAKAGRLF
jgi:methylated-DNA-[protein]-cysteine S-methyltransferase